MVPGRAVAFNRAGVPIQRTAAETGVDTFFIPPGVKPQGWSWEWKRETVNGEADPMYMSHLHQVGWEPVMYESYPGIFAPRFDTAGNETKGPVRRGGQMLMERAQVLTDEAFADERRKAEDRVGLSRKQYSASLQDAARNSTTAEYDITAQRTSFIRTAVENVNPTPPDQRQRVE
jgi:hypothetical protein